MCIFQAYLIWEFWIKTGIYVCMYIYIYIYVRPRTGTPAGAKGFSLLRNRPDLLWDPPRLLFNWYWDCFEGKKRPEREVVHWPASSADRVRIDGAVHLFLLNAFLAWRRTKTSYAGSVFSLSHVVGHFLSAHICLNISRLGERTHTRGTTAVNDQQSNRRMGEIFRTRPDLLWGQPRLL
jgi:hypothetical protein